MNWVTTFTLSASDGLSDIELADSDELRRTTSAIVQLDPTRIRVALWQEGHATEVVGKGLAALWTALEEVRIEAQIESLTLDDDLDCTSEVRELELLRSSLLELPTSV